MPHDLPKAYDPTAIEDKWAEYWVRENLFAQPAPAEASSEPAEGDSPAAQSFTILLPPPNVTGRLHMGHMLNQTEMDILARWHRMRGDRTLWIPGTDHAGIATQMMVEKQLVAEGTSRKALGREAFEARVWQWRDQYGKAILDQMKRLGVSVDWQREYFTMDAGLSTAVREAFTRLYHQDLIYRGAYIVNWCPGCQTAVSDLEVVHEESTGKLWEIRYPVANPDGTPSSASLTIATTRPETMLGDVAVAVHPDDERYKHLHGKKLLLPLGPGVAGREIPIVLDTWVTPTFGTGAVKITPAHDPNDYALALRHHLPSINIMDDMANIALPGSPYHGLNRFVARKRILEDLEAQGLLGTIREHKLAIGHCDRSGDVIEPRLSTQWFVAVKKTPRKGGSTLAEMGIAAVTPESSGSPVASNTSTKKAIQFTPAMYEKTYLNWMENIFDWCISRQLWWGHQIPAWHCAVCRKITVPLPGQSSDPIFCAHCNSPELTRETDVLDTWFSSALLPVSVLGWPFLSPDADGRAGSDFHNFYPTSLLVTGFDILFFWVARMIMLGCWFSQEIPLADGSPRPFRESVPFRDVYIHALVRDAKGDKMAKTKGNVIDPIEIVKQYGTDAVRFTLASMASPGTDIAFNIARTEGYRAFANKIWNAARFLFMNVDRAAEIGITVDPSALGGMPTFAENAPLEARWIVAEFHKTAAEVNASLENYRYDDAANTIYQFFWGSFCDWYLEIVKIRLAFSETADKPATRAALTTFVQVFEASLRLLSPFMPFITEEIWHAIYAENPPLKSIAIASYPGTQADSMAYLHDRSLLEMKIVQKVVTSIRSLRKDSGVPDKEIVPAAIYPSPEPGALTKGYVAGNQDIFCHLAKLTTLALSDTPFGSGNVRSEAEFDVAITYEATIDIPAERERLTKEIAKLGKNLVSAERQLGNEAFLAKAPAEVVDGLKKQEAENRLLLVKAREALEALPLN